MSFRLLDSFTLPGDPAKANEDAFGHDGNAAVVMDGATPLGDPLMPGPSDAAWIAQFGARRLIAHLKDGDAPQDAVRNALADAQRSFIALSRGPIREKWQTPCSSMMLVTEVADGQEFLWFGDCAALIVQSADVSLIGETIAKRGQEAARAKSWAGIGPLTGPNRSEEMLAKHRAGRNHVNSKRHWLFSPEPRAADHVSRTARSLAPGSQILLTSDGFLALVSDYGAYDPSGLMAAVKAKGLAALGAELRAIEDGDATAEKFPRFKKSDDATALLLEVVSG